MSRSVDYAKIVGSVVRQQRDLQGLSSADMAIATGLSPSGWSRVETGDTTMNVNQLRTVSEKLQIEPWRLIRLADRLAKEIGA